MRQKRSFEDIIDGSPMSNVPPILGGFIAAACQAALALRASAVSSYLRDPLALYSETYLTIYF